MAGHTLTPYQITATRKRARKNKDPLLLAAVGKDQPVDVLDALETHLVDAPPLVSTDETRQVRCVAVDRDGDLLQFIVACDIRGEREVVHDGDAADRPAVFEKNKHHVTRYYSSCLIYRSPTATEGILLVHSPWGRGGSKGQILKILQRALDCDPDVKALLHADALVPAGMLYRLLQNAKATKITYRKDAGVSSEFEQVSGRRSAPAEFALTVKGTTSLGYRDALTKALKSGRGKGQEHQLFTVQVRSGPDGEMHDETFDDVDVTIESGGTTKVYSVGRDTFPTVSTNVTTEFNSIYWALPDGKYDQWPVELLRETGPILSNALSDARSSP